jgi:RsiW-degrading membrane proteinase PrsW (M82 family)
MVSMWWVVGAFLAGGYAGFLLFALLVMTRDGETARERERAQRSIAHAAAKGAASAN